MRGDVEVTVPEVALVIGTRAALGIGLGLLLANHCTQEGRTAIGRTLLIAGAFTGAVLASELFARPRRFHMRFGSDGNGHARQSDNRERIQEFDPVPSI